MGKNIHAAPFDEGTQIKLYILQMYLKEWFPVFIAKKELHWSKIFIYDFFCGPGKDVNGRYGSPLIIMKELSEYCTTIRKRSLVVNVHFNDMETEKMQGLSSNIDEFMKESCDSACASDCALNITYSNNDFESLFMEKYPEMKRHSENPHFLFLDQNGIKFVTDDVFRKITSLARCDFIFFISSSYLWRFADVPEFQRYLKISGEVFDGQDFFHCHRVVFNYYKKLLTDCGGYFLAPFSIKKGGNIYGLIFGSRNMLGIEKFLKIGWGLNGQTGDANFDIDDEKINPRMPSLFEEMNRSTKLKEFENALVIDIKSGRLKTNKDVYLFAFDRGCLPKHANEVLRKMIKDGDLEKDIHMSANNVHNLPKSEIRLK
jgi:three-Cys-motif partner protein